MYDRLGLYVKEMTAATAVEIKFMMKSADCTHFHYNERTKYATNHEIYWKLQI
jgi:hypothetical protein